MKRGFKLSAGLKPSIASLEKSNKLILFDLSINGHHPSYIRHLISYWQTQKLCGSLDIIVSPKFIQHHQDVVDLATNMPESNISFIQITAYEETQLKARTSGINRKWRAFQEWNLVCKYCRLLEATHCILLYLDTYLLPLIVAKIPPCPISGILFRPTFHYHHFAQQQTSEDSAYWTKLSRYWQTTWEKVTLRHGLANPQLTALFCLDPFAVQEIKQLRSSVKVVALPDPVEIIPVTQAQVTQLKQHLEIELHRSVFLLFGALTGRKGIYEVLDAVSLLAPTLSQQLCLVLAGQANDQERSQIDSRVEALLRSSSVQIISCPQYIPESEVPVYFQMANVVLATYQHHVGMSGILLHAAAAGKPVLSSDYGLMGELVRRYRLGLTVDSSSPPKIAENLTRGILEDVQQWADPQQMQAFAKQNNAQKFAETLFEILV